MIGVSTILLTVLCLGSVNSQYDVIFFDYALPPPSPLHLMVDVTNQLAYSMLFNHGLTNNNNYAFSPCGLASVLVAVYEGCIGRSSVQIYNTLQLPADRHITRVGFRDIHRRLRSYFFVEDNILNGLHFNHDSVVIRVEYHTILRFYGYEAGAGLVPPMQKITTTPNSTNEEEIKMTTMMFQEDDMTTMSSTEKQPDPTTMAPTTITGKPTLTEVPATTEIPTTTEMPATTIPPTIPTTVIPKETPTTIPTTTTTESTTTPVPITTESPIMNDVPTELPTTSQRTDPPITTTPKVTMTTESTPLSTVPSATEPTTIQFTTEEATTIMPTTLQAEATTDTPTNQPLAKLIDQATFRPLTRIPVKKLPPPDKSRIARSAQFEIHNFEPSAFLSQLNQFPPFGHVLPIQNPVLEDANFADLNPRFAPPTGKYDENSEVIIRKLFYLNPFESINIPYKLYNTTLRYTYINKIKSTVLELPLDSDNYNLLLISPDFEFGLDALLTSMQSGYAPSIRDIKKRLKSAWVRAIVPNFELQGNVVLTGDLQNMGITDIFEPTRANFSPMTEEEGIYARNIEQAINVKIRINANDQLKRIYYRTPIDIMFNRPFLFFIVDTEMDLVVMTGRILNPLNSRIL